MPDGEYIRWCARREGKWGGGGGGEREREKETFIETQQVTEESLDNQQMTGEMCQEDENVDGDGDFVVGCRDRHDSNQFHSHSPRDRRQEDLNPIFLSAIETLNPIFLSAISVTKIHVGDLCDENPCGRGAPSLCPRLTILLWIGRGVTKIHGASSWRAWRAVCWRFLLLQPRLSVSSPPLETRWLRSARASRAIT